ncbi:MAG: hypothetical protein ACJAUG_001141 [Halioglobus sp.]|jgi:hypothetical protein
MIDALVTVTTAINTIGQRLAKTSAALSIGRINALPVLLTFHLFRQQKLRQTSNIE